MQKFWELFERSIIVQGTVTLALILTLCAMFLMSKPVPDTLIGFAMLVLGYWFGTKAQYAIDLRAATEALAAKK
jgi:hypothetical protein